MSCKFYPSDEMFRPTIWFTSQRAQIVLVLGWEWPWRIVRLR
jgi:hypothetical protein